ncbi:hypothetical protein [Longimicrobium terrae]|uniref:SnoaL-like domain-containing protein n=1 Tax=Longimicrobium terrae TaxID=1639882 RepID=A0A841GUU0_9BACT|nr:hypothetical protein [Longimicrobium terrae]MBB4634237.1 hypothetical protein [Longimicrobium terrae]MBB6068873.1 hypothetical protein [Longimicrobium terrae]NNC28053.1 hypothetical protein [Longimicrobium terrae]
MKHRARLLLLMLCAGCSASETVLAADTEEVYQTVLGECCFGHPAILQQVTDTAGLSGPDTFTADDELMNRFSPAVLQAVEDLRRRSASVYPLPDSVRASHHDQRVSADSARALIRAVQRDKVDRLPDRASVVLVSTVGFSRDGQLAVVQIVEVCGEMCGGVTLRAVRKHPGGWFLAEEVFQAVS